MHGSKTLPEAQAKWLLDWPPRAGTCGAPEEFSSRPHLRLQIEIYDAWIALDELGDVCDAERAQYQNLEMEVVCQVAGEQRRCMPDCGSKVGNTESEEVIEARSKGLRLGVQQLRPSARRLGEVLHAKRLKELEPSREAWRVKRC